VVDYHQAQADGRHDDQDQDTYDIIHGCLRSRDMHEP
jgi:hypothetical protein